MIRRSAPFILIVLIVVLGIATTAVAGPFTTGPILANTDGIVYEYHAWGGLPIQQLAVVHPVGGGGEVCRGFTVDDAGNLYAYNGTSDPYVSHYAGSWVHNTHTDWRSGGNISYGGIGLYQNYVFVTDYASPGGTPNGIIRFDTSDWSSQRFADGANFIDLTIGLDGLLYGLYPGGSPGGTGIDVFDPANMSYIRTITPTWGLELRGIAVAADGTIYAAAWSGEIYEFDSNGATQNSITVEDLVGLQFQDLIDIDLAATGDIIIGTRFSYVVITDRTLAPANSSYIGVTGGTGSGTTFVSFSAASAVPTRPSTWGRLKSLYGN